MSLCTHVCVRIHVYTCLLSKIISEALLFYISNVKSFKGEMFCSYIRNLKT